MTDPQREAEVAEVVRRPSRLRALAELGANAESSAEALDRIGALACRALGVPVAMVNLIGRDRQRFVGCSGPEPWPSMGEMPVTAGFCPFVISVNGPYSIDDARTDPAFATNPAVQQLGVVAYAGVPLRAADGEPIGTLCALDYAARAWSADDLDLLADLAEGVVAELRLLTASRLLARDRARLRDLAALSSALAPARDAGDVVEEVSGTAERLGANAVWLSVFDESGTGPRTVAAYGAGSEGAAMPEPPAEVMRTGRPDFLESRAEVRDRFTELLDAVPGVGSVAVLPLRAGEERLGVLGFCFTDERPLSGADREYLAAIGGLSALTLARRSPSS